MELNTFMGYALISDVTITSLSEMKQLFNDFNTYTNRKKHYFFDFKCRFKLSDKIFISTKFHFSSRNTDFNEINVLNFIEKLFKNKELISELLDLACYPNFPEQYAQLTILKIEKSIKLINTLNNAQHVIPDIENVTNLINILPYHITSSFSNLSIEKLKCEFIANPNYFILSGPFFDLYFSTLPQIFYKFMSLDPRLNFKINNFKIKTIQKF